MSFVETSITDRQNKFFDEYNQNCFNNLFEQVPLLFCNPELEQYAPSSSFWWVINRYDPQWDLPCNFADPLNYNWWFSIFFDSSGYCINAFYPKQCEEGQQITVLSNEVFLHETPYLGHSWVHGKKGLVKDVLCQWFLDVAFEFFDSSASLPKDLECLSPKELREFCDERLVKWQNTQKSGRHATKNQMIRYLRSHCPDC